jgi:hypothetical protein
MKESSSDARQAFLAGSQALNENKIEKALELIS